MGTNSHTGSETENLSISEDEGQNADLPVAETEEGTSPQDLMDVINDVVADTKAQEDDETPLDDDDEEDPSDQGENSEEEELDTPDGKKPSFQDHPKWREMIDRKNELEAENERLQEKAQNSDQITQFLTTNGLSPDDGAGALQIRAYLAHAERGDLNAAQAAYRELVPIVRDLEGRLGMKLTQDMQQQVEEGFTTPEIAGQMATLQAQNRALQAQLQQLTDTTQQREQEETQRVEAQKLENFKNEALSVAADWESQKRQVDPDFERKAPFLQNALAAWHQQNGTPQTIEDVNRAMEDAYNVVNEQLASIKQPKREIVLTQKRPSRGTGKSTAPDSFADAFNMGLKGE